MALNAHFLAKNHFFTITTPKPGYIYLNNFFWENFSKKFFGPLGPPLGYLGSLSQNRLGQIFSKCGFLNLLSPLGLPIPSYALLLAKKLKKFPRGCVLCAVLCDRILWREYGKSHFMVRWFLDVISLVCRLLCLNCTLTNLILRYNMGEHPTPTYTYPNKNQQAKPMIKQTKFMEQVP